MKKKTPAKSSPDPKKRKQAAKPTLQKTAKKATLTVAKRKTTQPKPAAKKKVTTAVAKTVKKQTKTAVAKKAIVAPKKATKPAKPVKVAPKKAAKPVAVKSSKKQAPKAKASVKKAVVPKKQIATPAPKKTPIAKAKVTKVTKAIKPSKVTRAMKPAAKPVKPAPKIVEKKAGKPKAAKNVVTDSLLGKTDEELKKNIKIEPVDLDPKPMAEILISVLVPAKKKRVVGRPRKKAPKQPKSTEPETPQFLTTIQEKSIIKKVQDGEVGAFEQLVNAYKQKAFYVALNLVKNHEDALDLAQDAFVKAFKAIKSFDLEAAFFPWFYKIIRNHCLNHIKKNQRIRNDSLQEIEEETYQQFQDTKPKPRDQYHTDETCNLLWNSIERLKPDFREIITLKHFHNLSYKEIAEALNIPIGTVMSRLFNARQELRDLVRRAES
ncbi:MAG: sigma-70 family RNA polymerase sigma factor [Candidatus Sumerlaeales bacterium]|nr:sigma-70 family RNA polymerase sigma factor [Candidatus Sumerlaeales bacterium]